MSLSSNGGNKSVQSRNYIGSIPRTKVMRNLEYRATFSAGTLFPIYCEEIYPAMNKKIKQGSFVRSITPLGPVMDKSFLDVFYFFVPFRLIWDHWEEFIAGYNKEAWTQGVEYVTPQIKFKYDHGSVEDKNKYLHSFLDYLPGACDVVSLVDYEAYLGAEVSQEALTSAQALKLINNVFSISALYPRAYARIWNDWFRDENLQDELEIYTGDNDEYADEFCFDLLDPTKMPKAGKYHNRFTTVLPQPQKGPDVLIPMNDLPVGIKAVQAGSIGATTYLNVPNGGPYAVGDFVEASAVGSNIVSGGDVVAKNVSNTIRMLRLATQTELLLARDARGGTRYVESLLSHWSTHNGDARLQRSEYLGSRQIPLQVLQVTNTTQSESGALGNVGAQSVTKDVGMLFSKGFSEYGVVLGLATVRTNLSYGSGRRKQFARKGRFEYIWPEFRHIGDVELPSSELDQGVHLILNGGDGTQVFGFTPFGSELREGINLNAGEFRSRASGSLDYLTYQESYPSDTELVLSGDYIEQSDACVSRTLVDQSGPQYYALFSFVEESVIPLDPTSDPGLMDHF